MPSCFLCCWTRLYFFRDGYAAPRHGGEAPAYFKPSFLENPWAPLEQRFGLRPGPPIIPASVLPSLATPPVYQQQDDEGEEPASDGPEQEEEDEEKEEQAPVVANVDHASPVVAPPPRRPLILPPVKGDST